MDTAYPRPGHSSRPKIRRISLAAFLAFATGYTNINMPISYALPGAGTMDGNGLVDPLQFSNLVGDETPVLYSVPAWVCRDHTESGIKTATLWPTRYANENEVELKLVGSNAGEMAINAIRVLEGYANERYENYSNTIETLWSEIQEFKGTASDFEHVRFESELFAQKTEPGCEFEPATAYDPSAQLPQDRILAISIPIWEKLSREDQALLLIYHLVNLEAVKLGFGNTEGVANLVARIANGLKKENGIQMSPFEFVDLLTRLGFESVTVGKIPIRLGTVNKRGSLFEALLSRPFCEPAQRESGLAEFCYEEGETAVFDEHFEIQSELTWKKNRRKVYFWIQPDLNRLSLLQGSELLTNVNVRVLQNGEPVEDVIGIHVSASDPIQFKSWDFHRGVYEVQIEIIVQETETSDSRPLTFDGKYGISFTSPTGKRDGSSFTVDSGKIAHFVQKIELR